MGRLTAPHPIKETHDLQHFDCTFPSLNDWLIRRAIRNEHSGASRTYVVCEGNRVVGYYCLAAGSIARKQVPGKMKRNMPEPVPVLVLGRLAVDLRFQGKGIGQGLLKDAVARSINVAEQIGIKALIVHALNQDAEKFYLGHGFSAGLPVSNTLFLSLNTV